MPPGVTPVMVIWKLVPAGSPPENGVTAVGLQTLPAPGNSLPTIWMPPATASAQNTENAPLLRHQVHIRAGRHGGASAFKVVENGIRDRAR